jgi:hypothetical protein
VRALKRAYEAEREKRFECELEADALEAALSVEREIAREAAAS